MIPPRTSCPLTCKNIVISLLRVMRRRKISPRSIRLHCVFAHLDSRSLNKATSRHEDTPRRHPRGAASSRKNRNEVHFLVEERPLKANFFPRLCVTFILSFT